VIAAGTYLETLEIGKSVDVLGAGASDTIIDGAGGGWVVLVPRGVSVAVRGVTIRGGEAENGAGINNSGTLTLRNSTVSNNRATSNGGGIFNDGTLTLRHSTVSGNNTAGQLGNAGGIFNDGGTVTLRHSTVSGNDPDKCNC
jgi:predicted outer membrane repeat protein